MRIVNMLSLLPWLQWTDEDGCDFTEGQESQKRILNEDASSAIVVWWCNSVLTRL